MEDGKNRAPASQETIDNLCKTAKDGFEVSFLLLSDSIATHNQLNEIELNNSENSEFLSFWKALFKLNIYTLFVNLDINTIFRANFKSQSHTEKRSNLKYVNVITLEGYRYMFGSKRDKLNAVWIEVSDAINQFAAKYNEQELTTDLDEIESKADAFKQKYATQKDVDDRNLAIHYDMNPVNVWKYLDQIEDEDYECKRLSAFLSYIELISKFICKWMLKYNIPLNCVKANIDLVVQDIVTNLIDGEDKVYDASGNALLTYANSVDSMMRLYNKAIELVKKVSEESNIEVDGIPEEQLESIYPGIQIAFLYIDIATATRAYLKSEHYVERILNLRRINVIVYEGFKKLYGFSEVQRSKSFWRKHICSILDNIEDNTIKENVHSIEEKLKTITQDPIINNFDLRGYSVHYRYEGEDNLNPLYNELLKFNMISELTKAKLLLNILPQLLEMTTKAMSHKNVEDNAKVSQKFDNLIAEFNTAMDTLSNQPSCPSEYKNKFIDAKGKFKDMICKFKL